MTQVVKPARRRRPRHPSQSLRRRTKPRLQQVPQLPQPRLLRPLLAVRVRLLRLSREKA